MNHGEDLRAWTLAWSRKWWDPDQRLLVNPPGSVDELAPPGWLLQVVENDPSDQRAHAIWRTIGQRLAPDLFPN